MNVYAPVILCFVPFITMFLLFAILVPGISVLKEFAASLAGLLAFIPIAFLQFFIPELRLFHQVRVVWVLAYSLVFCGLVEEAFKALSLLILKVRGETLKNFFLYSLLAGMVLGCFESVVYLLFEFQRVAAYGSSLPAVKLIYLRMGTALVIHTLCAALGGFTVFYGKNIRRNFSPFIYAVVIHGVYDFFVSFDTSLRFFSIAVILLAALECRIIYLSICEELSSKKFRSRKIEDPNKTVEIPENPALVISVKGTAVEKPSFFRKKGSEEVEDFDRIQKEAEAALKAEEKASVKKVSAKKPASKPAAEKTVAVKKTSAKTTVKPAPQKTAAKKAAPAKKTSEKAGSKKTVASKTGTTGGTKKAAARNTEKKASSKTSEKPAVRKTAAKTSPAPKRAVSKGVTKKAGSGKK